MVAILGLTTLLSVQRAFFQSDIYTAPKKKKKKKRDQTLCHGPWLSCFQSSIYPVSYSPTKNRKAYKETRQDN